MIYVSKSQLTQVEYLIGQSKLGNHVLFTPEEVRKALNNHLFTEEEAYSVEPLIEKLILLPTLQEKKSYLNQLDPITFEKVIKTYFNIVENSILENEGLKH